MKVTLGISTALGEKIEEMDHRMAKGFKNPKRKI